MYKSLELLPCKKCNRLIESNRLEFHTLMCSTAYLRQSYNRKSKFKQSQLKKCTFCQQKFEQGQYDYHINLDCKHRLVPCIDCDDMFPLSLFNQHLKVCRGNKEKNQKQHNKIEEDQEEQNTALNNLMIGLGTLGGFLYEKGCQVAGYCSKIIQQNRAPVLLYLEKLRAKIQDAFEDFFISIAYDENVESMPRDLIRKIPLSNYQKKGQQTDTCTICICQFQQDEVVKVLKCNHIFHPSCIDKWLKINCTCPLCKMDQIKQ